MIVRLFHFYKTKWQTVHKQSNVRSELVLSVLAGKLGSKMKCVVSDIVEVNQFYRRYSFKTIVETTTEIIIIQLLTDVFQNLEIFSPMFGIQSFKLLLKNWQQNIRVTIIDDAIFVFTQLTEVSISYSGEMNHCRHLYPCCFRKLFHITYPSYRLSNPLNPLVVSPLSGARSPNWVESDYKHKHLPC